MIEVVNRQRLLRIEAPRIAALAEAVLGALGRVECSLTVAFVRDPAIRRLNRDYRANDRPTDVLSFPAAGDEGDFGEAARTYLGDVVIATDTAARQAAESGLPPEREIAELVLHGVLHLCGYDHERDKGEMNRLERKLRRKLLDNS